jgi:hypothetical protein
VSHMAIQLPLPSVATHCPSPVEVVSDIEEPMIFGSLQVSPLLSEMESRIAPKRSPSLPLILEDQTTPQFLPQSVATAGYLSLLSNSSGARATYAGALHVAALSVDRDTRMSGWILPSLGSPSAIQTVTQFPRPSTAISGTVAKVLSTGPSTFSLSIADQDAPLSTERA